MGDDRIAKLSERFTRHQVGRKSTTPRNRERRSFYLDGALIERLDKAHRSLNHELYPGAVNKSVFLETLMEYSLTHLEELRDTFTALAGADEERTTDAE